jgi:hypothetical protein
MIISKKYKFVYLPPMKTGSSSLHLLLSRKYAANWIWCHKGLRFKKLRKISNKDTSNIKKRKNGLGLIRGKHIIHMPKFLDGYFVFATIRNPYTRMVSRYCHDKRSKLPFTNNFKSYLQHYLPKKHRNCLYYELRRNKDYIPPLGCIPFKINAYVRLEHLEEDFAKLPFIKTKHKFPIINTKQNKCSPKYTNKTASMVRKWLAKDFDYFGYNVNQIE